MGCHYIRDSNPNKNRLKFNFKKKIIFNIFKLF